MTNDAAVAWLKPDWQSNYDGMSPVTTHEIAGWEPLYSATTVAELRAEVECLRVELAGSQERALMVLRAKDDWMERANKAERRVADFVWRIENEAHQFVSPEGLIYLNYLKESITKESP